MLGSLLEKENKNKGQRSGFQADNVCGESYSSKNNKYHTSGTQCLRQYWGAGRGTGKVWTFMARKDMIPLISDTSQESYPNVPSTTT